MLACYVTVETKDLIDAKLAKLLAKHGARGNIHLGTAVDELVRKGKA